MALQQEYLEQMTRQFMMKYGFVSLYIIVHNTKASLIILLLFRLVWRKQKEGLLRGCPFWPS
uniref:Uncharacterized protein n=1 Tax=Rhizophora mucronata TaxID=61149 RepID=A0A2P2ITH3_RHIMU